MASLEEDPLRLLRAFRFAARFGFTLERGLTDQFERANEVRCVVVYSGSQFLLNLAGSKLKINDYTLYALALYASRALRMTSSDSGSEPRIWAQAKNLGSSQESWLEPKFLAPAKSLGSGVVDRRVNRT